MEIFTFIGRPAAFRSSGLGAPPTDSPPTGGLMTQQLHPVWPDQQNTIPGTAAAASRSAPPIPS